MEHQGQKLKGYIRDNGRAFTKSAKDLGISLEKLNSYFDDYFLDEETFQHVCSTLALYPISPEPFSISIEALKQLKLLEGSEALSIELVDALNDKISRLKNIIEHKNETLDLLGDNYLKSIAEIEQLKRLKEPSFSEFFKRCLLNSKNTFINFFKPIKQQQCTKENFYTR